MRFLVLSVALTCILTFSGSSTVQAAPPTCQGEAATVVGSPGGDPVVGTDGPDVIISNGSDVDARGGADTICVSGQSAVVTAGPGNDSIRVRGLEDVTIIDGGPGTDALSVVSSDQAPWTVDVPAQQLSTDEASSALLDVERFGLGRASWSSLSFTGGEGPEVLDLTGERGTSSERPFTVRLAGGDDELRLMPGQAGQSEAVVGGRGHDSITLARHGRKARQSVFGSTRHHSFSIDRVTDTLFFGFEDVAVSNFAQIELEAGTIDNVLHAVGCQATLQGSSGNDVLEFRRSSRCDGALDGAGLIAEGGPGNDVMRGSRTDDVLRGQSGHDLAVGGSGDDRCVAEARRSCES